MTGSDYCILRITPLLKHGNATLLTNASSAWSANVGNIIEPNPDLEIAFDVDDATPEVNVGVGPYKTNNSNATTVTNFDSGVIGQIIQIKINDANTTIDFTGTSLHGNVGVDWSPASNDAMICYYNGTDWFCQIIDTTA